jgi:hypothetical protein
MKAPLYSAIFLFSAFFGGWAWEFVNGPLSLEGYRDAILIPGTTQSEADQNACIDNATNLGGYVAASPEPTADDDGPSNIQWQPTAGDLVQCTDGKIRVFKRNDGRFVGVPN